MRHVRPALTLCAMALLLVAPLASPAIAHGGHTPFTNCAEAYANGHANIPASSAHYQLSLDRDKDGVGCDSPPDNFTPAPSATSVPTRTVAPPASGPSGSTTPGDLAETGSGKSVVLLFGAGLALGLTGGLVLRAAHRSRRP